MELSEILTVQTRVSSHATLKHLKCSCNEVFVFLCQSDPLSVLSDLLITLIMMIRRERKEKRLKT